VAPNVVAVTFKPPLPRGSSVIHGNTNRHGCAQITAVGEDLATGGVGADTYVHAGSIVNPCTASSINMTVGFASPTFAPTFTGTHKIAFHWSVAWNVWLNSTCGTAGCSRTWGSVTLQGIVYDTTTRTTVKIEKITLFTNQSTSGGHLTFGQAPSNYTIAFSAYLNGTQAYQLRTVLKTGVAAVAPAGGLFCSARVNVDKGGDGAWLTSMTAK
jgi:hypothetical protein